MIKQLALAALLAGVALSSPANATLQLAVDINGTTFTCADGAACDTNTNTGQLSIADQTIGGVQFLGSAQTQTIATGPGTFNTLNTSSFQVINNTGGTVGIQLAIGGTGFIGPVTTYSASGGGTFQNAIGSDYQLTFFADHANTQGADTPTDFPGTQLTQSADFLATLPTDTTAFNNQGGFIDPDLFSMTMETTGNIIAGGSLVGRTQAIVSEVAAVPEPSSLLIMGSGLLGLVFFIRRRQRKLTQFNDADFTALA